ncbi:DNA polymerase II [Aliiglaciecola sp. LCG003]|uniref:DNA polymerase II n=1 Tax=Aliiglaciecola sp. LCG003 TaxID=3053655 RepID=UPI0025729337|nr:DNA polymerase II [Aliiglaciecola sp. LCG003]WJG11252.1 DNA polymerase II [Aliiglaciecola sp. LCG003]
MSAASTHRGFVLTRNQIERSGQTYLEFWLSTDSGPVKLITQAQQAVMFVAKSEASRAKQVLLAAGLKVLAKELSLKTFTHQRVEGLYFQSNSQFYRAREVLNVAAITSYENDIRLTDRYLMERFICASANFVGRQVATSPSAPNTYTQYENAKLKPAEYVPQFTLLSLDIECSLNGELYSVGLSALNFKRVIMIGNPQGEDDWITWAADESDLLQQLMLVIGHQDPDIIIGWNVVNFDFRLLVERAKLNNIKLKLGRDNSEVFWREPKGDSQQGFVSIAGRVVIDGIDSLKTATYHFDSFSLQHVSEQLLGKSKQIEDVDNRVAAITHDFQHDKIKLARYNLQDCILVEEIFQHTKLIDYLILRSQITGLELDRMGGSVAAFINLYLPKLHRAGFISPNRPIDGGLASPGGYVMTSQPGLYKNVLVLDFKSLYPSIIRTFKIDPLGLVEGLAQPDDAIPGFRGALFSRDKHFLPDIIDSLWKQRDEAKRQQNSARSQAIKILMNSFYGVLGSGGCPFYDTRLASSITLRGHEIMQTTASWIEQCGYKVIYGDTDSTFVWLEHVSSPEEAQRIGQQLETSINQQWQQKLKLEYQLDCHLEIEFETLFETFLMPTIRGSELGSKKRYAGVKRTRNGDTELIFKGLETVRSDWTAIAKIFQQTLYQRVFDGQDITSYMLGVIDDIRQANRDSDLVYRKRLRQRLDKYTKNVPPHVKAARLADQQNQKLGKPLQYQHKGWISYVITLDGPQPIEYVSSRLDYEHYIEKQIRPIAEGILPFVGQSFEQITSSQLGLF